MGFKDIVENTKKWVHGVFERWKDISRFRTLLFDLSSELFRLNGPVVRPSQETTALYNRLRTDFPEKYPKEKAQYEALLSRIATHDSHVQCVEGALSTFSYEEVLQCPKEHTVAEFSRYDETLSIIKSYAVRAPRYETFVRQVEELKANLAYIQEQYDYSKRFTSITVLDGDYYLDEDRRQALLEKVRPLQESIRKASKAYYRFPGLDDLQSRIDAHNEAYVQAHLDDAVFDDVGGRSLDEEQRRSILKDEKSCLTIAGAGSGKTLTICGKVKYLLEHDGVKPEDILLLSYSRKSAEDLAARVALINPECTVGTFHKTGLDILKYARNEKPTVEEQFDAIIETYFREELMQDPKAIEDVFTWFAYFFSPNRRGKKYTDDGQLFEDLKKSDLCTFKDRLLSFTLDHEARMTIKKERVKSFEEMVIANFYFINGIEYVYEAPYAHKTAGFERRQYTPDFFLKDYNIYHEHYGIGRDGVPHQYDDEQARTYIEGMQWKRTLHERYETICLETYSYEFDEGIILPNLREQLTARGVVFKPLTFERIREALQSIYLGKNFGSFINLVKSFLSLYKARYRDESHFAKLRSAPLANGFSSKRSALFLNIAERVYRYYMSSLRESGKIDFDDMILQSMEALDSTDGFRYKHIIVDEFQDISYSRMRFLKKLIERGDARLYAVGDDWQAIYRFAGCDLDILLRFDRYFGRAATSYITSTHRNAQQLQDIVGPFIMANPEQMKKSIRSNKSLDKPVKVVWSGDQKYAAFRLALGDIYRKDPHAKILVLGRNNNDIDDYLSIGELAIGRADDNGLRRLKLAKYDGFEIRYSTVHGSKGLEEDYVILINANDGRLGFPNRIEDDEILNLVLSGKSEFKYAEERRLWYVALTRTRNYVYLIADSAAPSPFLEEILSSCEQLNEPLESKGATAISCPRCKSGHLVLRENSSNGNMFYGCSNYPYCDYSIDGKYAQSVRESKMCPRCGDFMVRRSGKWGPYSRCYNQQCKYTENESRPPRKGYQKRT